MFTLKHLLLFHPSTYKHIKAGEVKAGNVRYNSYLHWSQPLSFGFCMAQTPSVHVH